MPTKWLLKELLERYGVTPYALSMKTHGRLSRNAVYRLVNDPARIDIASLDALVPALRELTGETIVPADLFGWTED